MTTENQITHAPDSTGKSVRTLEITTLVNGVPTTVQMQVIAIADEGGNVIRDFANYNLQLMQIAEARALRRTQSIRLGAFDPIPESFFPFQP
jgi:hypothetical protein